MRAQVSQAKYSSFGDPARRSNRVDLDINKEDRRGLATLRHAVMSDMVMELAVRRLADTESSFDEIVPLMDELYWGETSYLPTCYPHGDVFTTPSI